MNDLSPTTTTAMTTTIGADIAPQNRATMGILNPNSLDEALRMSQFLADSSLVPKDFQGKPGNVLIACQWGAEIGLAPLQAMQSIAVINGRPAIWGDAMLALVMGSGALVDITENVSDDGQIATCTLVRKGKSPVSRQFTMDEAKKAGLAGKTGPWQQYPKRMLQLRARGFALRDVFPDVLRGVYIAEEAQDMPRDDAQPAQIDAEKGTAALRKKVGAKKADAPVIELDDVVARIEAATTEDELNKVGAECGKLTGTDKDTARSAYRNRLGVLKAEAAAAQEQAKPIGELIQSTDTAILRELNNGAPLNAALDFYGADLERIKAEAPDELAAMMAEYTKIENERG